jgi:uncharacterized protein (DUF1919 family)
MGTIAIPQRACAATTPVWEPLKLWRRRLAARLLQKRVPHRNFSIISNDCWGGMACEELAMPYQSPFVGLFLVPQDYVRMLARLQPALEAPLEFKISSRHGFLNEWREQTNRFYPIGMLPDEVEIHFLHYASAAEAKEKWQRRTARIHWDNLRIKLSWHEYPESEMALRDFAKLALPSKLMLVPPHAGIPGAVSMADFSTDGTQQYWRGHKAFDVAAYLRSGEIKHGITSRVLGALFYWRY